MTGKTIGIVVVIIVVAAGAWYFLAGPGSAMMAEQTAPGSGQTVAQTGQATTTSATVEYTDQGFSPATITVAQNATVTWINDSAGNLWVASDPHPIHNGYDGTTLSQHCAPGYAGPAPFDECTMLPPGGSWSFTFGKIGTWGYHNHADASIRGTVIVTAPSATSTGATASTSATVNVSL